MAVGKVRTGVPVAPQTTENAGTDNDDTDPRVLKFNKYARPCIVSWPAGNTSAIKVKVNAGVDATSAIANDFASGGDGPGYFTIAVGAEKDVSFEGIVAVQRVSFVTQNAGDDLDDVSVVGWEP